MYSCSATFITTWCYVRRTSYYCCTSTAEVLLAVPDFDHDLEVTAAVLLVIDLVGVLCYLYSKARKQFVRGALPAVRVGASYRLVRVEL